MRRLYSIFALAFVSKIVFCGDGNSNDGFMGTSSDLIELRGFEAIDHYVTTTDGYILNLVELLNPTLPNGYSESKDPILFIPGVRNNVNFFTINSIGARPENYADLNVNSMDDVELLELASSNPAANSLPFLASILGHSNWLLNRRGSSQSQGHVGEDKQPYSNPIVTGYETIFGGFLPLNGGHRKRRQHGNLGVENPDSDARNFLQDLQNTLNPRYWNFSLDEQARYDVPEVIEYVLKETKKEKLAVVGHSTGSALVLMALTESPDLASKSKYS